MLYIRLILFKWNKKIFTPTYHIDTMFLTVFQEGNLSILADPANTLAYWAQLSVVKNIKCCEYYWGIIVFANSLINFLFGGCHLVELGVDQIHCSFAHIIFLAGFARQGPILQNFFVPNLRIFVISQSVCPCKPFQPSLIFGGMAGA